LDAGTINTLTCNSISTSIYIWGSQFHSLHSCKKDWSVLFINIQWQNVHWRFPNRFFPAHCLKFQLVLYTPKSDNLSQGTSRNIYQPLAQKTDTRILWVSCKKGNLLMFSVLKYYW
jgi:hypothetical protein